MRPALPMPALALIAALTALAATPAGASENMETWELLVPRFESTGGGGIMIGEYHPVVVGSTCTTDFTATLPDGTVYYNSVVFDAVPTDGGILCNNGRWRARDGGATGTTPLRIFIKNGVSRRSP